ncbi:MAG: hypothetical protein HGN29_12645 [Asgard group archaeon]|nr:hypothetical protein [Asgard group archaeon]
MNFPKQSLSAEDHVSVRIIDADYPPKMRVYDEDNYTRFGITLDYQIENPTQESIKITYICAPFPFPRLNINLLNQSLKVEQLYIIELIAGERFISSGIRNDSQAFAFEIFGYTNMSLPQGTYELWLDYTNCSYVSVPVKTDKLIIDVTETSVTYYFDYNNEARIVYPQQLINGANFLFVPTILALIIVYKVKRKKEGTSK